MIKLYGIPLSNYTNMVRAALEEKGISYEFVQQPPSQKGDYTGRSPMGKVPCLETDGGPLAETSAILDYLEDLRPEPALRPTDPFERAKARELCKALELYVELVARKGIGAAFGNEVPEHVKKGMSRDLPRGMKAVGQLVKFDPWIAGPLFTYADLFGYYTLTLANTLSTTNCDIDLFALLPGSKAWYAEVGNRPTVAGVDADMAKARAAMGR